VNIVAWNTGKKYTPGGQKMAAVIENGVCSYVDAGRNLEGEFEARRMGGDGYADFEIKEIVMYLYSHNLGRSYISDPETRKSLERAAKEVPDA
jgi:hypothetical protein